MVTLSIFSYPSIHHTNGVAYAAGDAEMARSYRENSMYTFVRDVEVEEPPRDAAAVAAIDQDTADLEVRIMANNERKRKLLSEQKEK